MLIDLDGTVDKSNEKEASKETNGAAHDKEHEARQGHVAKEDDPVNEPRLTHPVNVMVDPGCQEKERSRARREERSPPYVVILQM